MSRNARCTQVFPSWLLLIGCLCPLWSCLPGCAAETISPVAGARSQVVIVRDPEATEAFRTRLERIQAMVDRGLTNLTGKATVAEACRTFASARDVVGIKVYSLPGPYSGTRPAVVEALVKDLLAAGMAPPNIVIWDRQLIDLRLAGFVELGQRYGVRVLGAAQVGYDPEVFYNESPILGKLVWGDLEFGKHGDEVGRKSFVSKLLTRDITRIINVAPMLNHNTAGVSGNLYSVTSGSVDNFARFEPNEVGLANAVPEIYGLSALFEKVVLSITDALICQYEGGERGLLHYSEVLNELRFSKDGVALDVLSIQELDRLRKAAGAPAVKANKDLYNNAALLELGVSDPKKIESIVLK